MTTKPMPEQGIQCPACGKMNFLVIESRVTLDGRRRRRGCKDCNYRETLYELTEVAYHELKQARTQLERVMKALGVAIANEVKDIIQPAVDELEPLCFTCKYNAGAACSLELPGFGTEASLDCLRYNRQ